MAKLFFDNMVHNYALALLWYKQKFFQKGKEKQSFHVKILTIKF